MKQHASLFVLFVGAVLHTSSAGIGAESVEFTYEKVEWVRVSAGVADSTNALRAAKKCESAGKTADVEQCLMQIGFRKRIDKASPLLAPVRR